MFDAMSNDGLEKESSQKTLLSRLRPSGGPDRPLLNPWLVLVLAAPIPLLLFVLFFVKWYQQKAEFSRIRDQFLQRQNSVLAYNALMVAVGYSDLLEKAGRDVTVLALLPPTAESLEKFWRAQVSYYTRYDTKNTAVIEEPLPFYNQVAVLDTKGNTILSLADGKADSRVIPLGACREADLCDRPLYEKSVTLKPGETYYGRLMRYYTHEGVDENPKHAGLSVAYRTEKNIFVVRIDYLQLRDHLTTPSFPYDPKKDLEQAYKKGNYIYIVDEMNNIITHPLVWVEAGIDRNTGKWAEPMRVDEEGGKKPMNIASYERGILKDYFDRLLKVSFAAKSVDIFRAPNLAGTNRVLSVVPIVVSKGQYKDKIYGHAVIGCNVDYFEEPKERVIPYY